MAKMSDSQVPSLLFTETANASIGTPAAGKARLFRDTDNILKWKDEAGAVSPIATGIAETLIDAKGDLIVGSAADTAARLAVGTNNHVLTADSAATNGVKWAASSGGGIARKFSKPAGNITRTGTTVGAFSTAWQITGVVVASGQNVMLQMSAAALKSAGNDTLFVFFRDSTNLAQRIVAGPAGAFVVVGEFTWIDENPGAGTYTYEVQAAQFSSGTLTVYQSTISTDTGGGASIFVAEVYTP